MSNLSEEKENTEIIDLSCYGKPREQIPEGKYWYVYTENIENIEEGDKDE